MTSSGLLIKSFRRRPALLGLLAVVLIGVGLLWKWNFSRPALHSSVYPTTLFTTASGQLIGFGYPAQAFENTPNLEHTKRPHYKASFLRWDMHTRRIESQQLLDVKPQNPVFSPDGKKVAFFTWLPDKKSHSRSQVEIRTLDRITHPGVYGPKDNRNFNWTPDSRSLIVHDEKIRIYDATTGALQRIFDPKLWQRDISYIKRLTFSPDGQHVAIQEESTSLPPSSNGVEEESGAIKERLFIASWPQLKLEGTLPGNLWMNYVWDKNSKQLQGLTRISAGYMTLQAKVARYDLASRRTSWAIIQPPSQGNEQSDRILFHNLLAQATFTPDGRLLIGGTLIRKEGWGVWDTSTGKYLGQMGKPWRGLRTEYANYDPPAFSLDSRYLLNPRNDGVEMWALERFAR